MSIFSGHIQEYKFIAVDNFLPKVKMYFLSHLHYDHYKGLQELQPSDGLQIYCSDITKQLFLADKNFSQVHSSVIGLELNVTHKIKVLADDNEGYELNVTLIQAGHCLGSVMFLFSGSAGNVLYTGDFRLDVGSAARIRTLHDGEMKKSLESIYVDTTFFIPRLKFIPSREACVDAVLEECEKWLAQSTNHLVLLVFKARYSYDYLSSLLRQKFGMKVHVSYSTFASYDNLPEFQADLTKYPNETRIHACRYRDNSAKLTCGYTPEDPTNTTHVLTIIPTTMWFQQRSFQKMVVREDVNRIRVCFSHHSSYSEVVDLLSYLRPKRAHACVKPDCDTTLEKVQSHLDALTMSWTGDGIDQVQHSRLGTLKTLRKRRRSSEKSKDSDDLLFNSEPMKKNTTEKKICPEEISPAGDQSDASLETEETQNSQLSDNSGPISNLFQLYSDDDQCVDLTQGSTDTETEH